MQSFRNALQKQLRSTLSNSSATFSRFVLATPLAALYLVLQTAINQNDQTLPVISQSFILSILIAAVAQIFATLFMVMLFKQRNYAVGVGLAKSEALIAATLGALFFTAPLNFTAWLGVIVGVIAVWLMAKPSENFSLNTLILGLASGLCFALCTLYVRQASLTSALPFQQAAAWVLFLVLSLQTAIFIAWISLTEPESYKLLWQHKTTVALTSLCGFIASVGWFTAMAIENVAKVKTLGQVEVFFTLLISYFFFKEKLHSSDYWGLILIALSAVLVII